MLPRVDQPQTTPPTEQVSLSKTATDKPALLHADQPQTTPPAQSLEENIQSITEAITEAAASSESQEVTLVISETEANAQAVLLLDRSEVPADIPLVIKSVYVDFRTGNIVVIEVETTLQVGFSVPVDIEITSQVDIADGEPTVVVTKISFIGSALLPQSVKDQITSLITENVDSLLAQVIEIDPGNGVKVELEYKDIEIREEEAIITAIAKPKL